MPSCSAVLPRQRACSRFSTSPANPIRERRRSSGRAATSRIATCRSVTSGQGPCAAQLSLDVPAGSTVALVGQSGSGKSTLVSLLPRFYDPEEGAVLLDGEDVRSYTLRDLRRQIGLVSQDIVLFDDTIANNIAYGALAQHSRADIERAAEAGLRLGVRCCAAARTRYESRRAGRDALGRATATDRDRPRVTQGCAGADPRRGYLGSRYRVGAPRASGADCPRPSPPPRRMPPPPLRGTAMLQAASRPAPIGPMPLPGRHPARS